jgi:ribulose-5-phosphate 4-epimerase/fuculose-1-phosphate aldolase
MTHAALYELSPRVNAVAHVHSAGLWEKWRDILPTSNSTVAYGTPEMAREFARLYIETDFANGGIAVMAGHIEGIIGIGEDMAEAAGRIMHLYQSA